MKASEILALSKAGYNAQQITLIDQELRSEASAQKQEQPKQEQPKQEQPKQEQPKQEQTKQEQPKQETALPGVEDIMAQLNKLTTAVYAGAINGSRQPEEQTPEDIIAQIIRPDDKNL